jgi:hypothetical protein
MTSSPVDLIHIPLPFSDLKTTLIAEVGLSGKMPYLIKH